MIKILKKSPIDSMCHTREQPRNKSNVLFFKQKTAYEMLSGDWSSDVCSSDLDTATTVVRSMGISAAIIEHDMDVVFNYSDRIVAMHQGTILADGTPDEIRRNEAVRTTLIGTADAH